MKDNKTIGRQRLAAFFDEGTFVELGAYLSRPGTQDAEGVVCGYGARGERLVFAFAQDASLMHGALDARHAQKIAATYEKALAVGAPIVGFFDCAGAVVFDGAAALSGYGTLLSTVSAASGVIPQIAVVCGKCVGSMAAVAAMFDLTVMVEGARLYVSSPSLVGEEIGTAAYTAQNGTVATVCESEAKAMETVGELLSYLPDCAGRGAPQSAGDALNRALREQAPASAAEALCACADGEAFLPLYKQACSALTAGFANMGGMPCVLLALDGELRACDVRVMTALVTLSNRFALPLVTFVNCVGFAQSAEDEPHMPSALAALAQALTQSVAPRVCALVGAAIGAGFFFGGAKTLGADVVFALPSAEISAMTASAGVAFLWNDRITAQQTREMLESEWKKAATPEAAAADGAVDDIVPPAELRARILAALMMLRDKGSTSLL